MSNNHEPFFLVCYDKHDLAKVLPVINRLEENGSRFVHGAAGEGQDYDELASALIDSHCVLNLITRGYVESLECRQLITFAQQKKKRIIDLYVESAELPSGLEMQLGRNRALRLSDGEGSTYDALLSLPEIEICRIGRALTKKEISALEEEIASNKVYKFPHLIPVLSYLFIGPMIMNHTSAVYSGFFKFLLQNLLPLPILMLLSIAIYAVMKRRSPGLDEDNKNMILAIAMLSIFVTTVADAFFIHTTESVILKILISLGINLLVAIASLITFTRVAMRENTSSRKGK